MWWIYVLIGIVVLIIALYTFSYFEAKKASVNLSPDEFKQNMRKGQLIDLRNRKDYDEGHINGARNIPFAMIAREYKRLRTDQPVYLYDNNGKVSKRAALYLQTRGFTEIYQLENGLNDWTDSLKRTK